MSFNPPLGDAFLRPTRFLQQADRLLRAERGPEAFEAVERGLEASFEAALREALRPSPAPGEAPVQLGHGATGVVAKALPPALAPQQA